MSEALTIQLNGKPRCFDGVESPISIEALLATLALKPDRVAVERNGDIVPRASWQKPMVCQGDRLEIVHFVGGGRDAMHLARTLGRGEWE